MFVVVGVTGGIAAYKAVAVVRAFVQEGHDVHVIPTPDALRFVGTATWEAISRNPVTTSVHDDVARVRHVSLGQSADLIVIAPATANSLAKMTAGLADDLLGTTLLATTAPVVVAPAMHTEMWRHPATQHNIGILRGRGVEVVGPEDGPLTGGDSGPGRMSEPDVIVAAALAAVGSPADAGASGEGAERGRDLQGLRVVVGAGGTREPIDPVRFLGNRSSGRQGVAVACAAADRGAEVTLVAAHIDADVLAAASVSPRVRVVRAGTAAELGDAVREAAVGADVVVMAAAVADYRVAEVSAHKLSKEQADGPEVSLHLVQTEDILAGLASGRAPGQTIVGFAAETPAPDETLLERGRRKAVRKGADLLAVNRVGWAEGFEVDVNALLLLDRRGELVAEARGDKRAVADALWDGIRKIRAER
ncbi:bifunctional phosphopantothenoylcysteine decarboxylase/phosphopantothenate--cysteine ligase CoaBC [Microbacterium aurantiacum]|uniref:bifunctional phosphopantothenoylcysteine decarboxylase/phosphopantothenate--cysteine ligase CoaBC n=3 Tax=Microbacterium aurantiacum TaxID=162393 RepID=UPI004035DCD3